MKRTEHRRLRSEGKAAGLKAARKAYTALGLQVDAEGNVVGTPDEARELRPLMDRYLAALWAIETSEFEREFSSDSARRLAERLLSFAEAGELIKATVERLKGLGSGNSTLQYDDLVFAGRGPP